MKFCKFVGNSYCLTMTNCVQRRRGRSPTAWFTQNGWASAVDSTADFLNSAQLPPFFRVTGTDGFRTKSLFTKRLRAHSSGAEQVIKLCPTGDTNLRAPLPVSVISSYLVKIHRSLYDYAASSGVARGGQWGQLPPQPRTLSCTAYCSDSWLDDTDKKLLPIYLYCLKCTKFG